MTIAEFADVSTPAAAEVEVHRVAADLVSSEAIDSASSHIKIGLEWADLGKLDLASRSLSRATAVVSGIDADKLGGDDGGERKRTVQSLIGRFKNAVVSVKSGGGDGGERKELRIGRSETVWAVRDRRFAVVLSKWSKACGSPDLVGTETLGEIESESDVMKAALRLCGSCVWALKVFIVGSGVASAILLWLSRCYLLLPQLPAPPLKCPGAPRADDERLARMEEWLLHVGPGRQNVGGGPDLDFIEIARQTPDGQKHYLGQLFLGHFGSMDDFDWAVEKLLGEHAAAGGIPGFPVPAMEDYHIVYYRHPHPPDGTIIRLEGRHLQTSGASFMSTIQGVLVFDGPPPDDLFSPLETEYVEDLEDDEGD